MAIHHCFHDNPSPVSPPEDWDIWVQSCEAQAGFGQSAARAAIVNALQDAPSYALRTDNEKAGALITHLPAQSSLLCLEGPVLTPEATPADLTELLNRINALSSSLKIQKIEILNPPVRAIWTQNKSFQDIFKQCGFHIQQWGTYLLDLSLDEDALFENFSHAARKGIRKCEKNGLYVEECLKEDAFLSEFISSYYEEETSDALQDRIKRSMTWWRLNTENGRIYRFFIVKNKKDAVMATLGTYHWQGIVTEIMSHRTQAGQNDNTPAQDLLHWEIFKTHKNAGHKFFNMAGFNPQNRSKKEEGIRRFKAKWGGQEVTYFNYTKETFSPFSILRRLYCNFVQNMILTVSIRTQLKK